VQVHVFRRVTTQDLERRLLVLGIKAKAAGKYKGRKLRRGTDWPAFCQPVAALLIAQRLDGIEVRSLSSRVVTEEDPDCRSKSKAPNDCSKR
jgi:hypothetical protein